MVAVAYGAVLVWVVLVSDYMRITTVDVRGTVRVSPETVRNAVWSVLSDTTWPNRLRAQYVLVPRKQVREAVQNATAVIRSVTVRKVFPHTIIVTIQEWDTVYAWCHSDLSCAVIYEDGALGMPVMNAEAPLLRENPVVRIIDDSATPMETIQTVCTTPSAIQSLLSAAQSVGYTVQQIHVAHPLHPFVTLYLERGWTLDVPCHRPQRIIHVAAALEDALSTAERDRLQRVDARVPRKIFYTLREAATLDESAIGAVE